MNPRSSCNRSGESKRQEGEQAQILGCGRFFNPNRIAKRRASMRLSVFCLEFKRTIGLDGKLIEDTTP